MPKLYVLEIKQYRTGWLRFFFELRRQRNEMLEAISADEASMNRPNEIRIYDIDEDDD